MCFFFSQQVLILLFIYLTFFFLITLDPEYFEFVPITGGHRRISLNSKQLLDYIQKNPDKINPESLKTWKFEIISEAVWDDPNCDTILRAIAMIDNSMGDISSCIHTNDTERLLSISHLLDNSKLRDTWTLIRAPAVTFIQHEMVLIFIFFILNCLSSYMLFCRSMILSHLP